MGIAKYNQKRKFDSTPEPKGKAAKHSGKLKFVVQQHHATAMHYDLRLEIDRVLKSWAVPRGPSLNPADHRLAMQTEDHPYDYKDFEGVIPAGNYGAGNVIIWDRGWYQPYLQDAAQQNEKAMRAAVKKGHLTFILHGQKLKGEFALIKMPDSKQTNAWLLVKKGDEFASKNDVTKLDKSVKSHKKVDDLGAYNKLPDLSGQPTKKRPWKVQPMLSSLVEEPFDDPEWLFEIKWDGFRAVASKHESKTDLRSRNGISFNQRFSQVAEALHDIKHDVILDGEIVSLDKDGKSHFEWLQNANRGQGQLKFMIFDVLWLDGHDLHTTPQIERKKILKALLPEHEVLSYSDHVEAKGKQLFGQMKKSGLEGMVAKRMDSSYQEGERGKDWLKIKTSESQELVVGGYTEPRGAREYFGSLVVGTFEKGKLKYAGHSGGGLNEKDRQELYKKLVGLQQKTSPFDPPPELKETIHWVKPKVIVEVQFSEWTSSGQMRHPTLKGVRTDKNPKSVVREKQKGSSFSRDKNDILQINEYGLPFEPTHLDKVFFPKYKYTKGDLFKYYDKVAKYMLPHLKDRPLSQNRMPDGIKGFSFFQKNNEHLPDWVPSTDIFSESNSEDLHWVVGGERDTLLYLVQLGSIEINPWNSRVKHLNKPDWIVIDLDPEGIGFDKVIEAARVTHDVCQQWGMPTYPKTSGKTGLHIYIPMGAKYSYDQAKNLAHLIVLEVNQRLPKTTSVERLPKKRKHKIYLDFLQNRGGQTLAAPYSVRPTEPASVSMPLDWSEVKSGLKPENFNIKNAIARLKRTGDLFKPVLGKPIDLKKVLQKAEKA